MSEDTIGYLITLVITVIIFMILDWNQKKLDSSASNKDELS